MGQLNEIFALAVQHQRRGDLQKAEVLYRQILEANPIHRQSKKRFKLALTIRMPTIHNLGDIYNKLGKTQQAINCYQKAIDLYDHVLASNPNDQQSYNRQQSAIHVLNSQVGVTTKTAPRNYIQALFDDYAARFDKHLKEILDYKVPQLLKNNLITQLGSNLTFDMAIDLGCGTGLSGEVFRPICKQLVGIDLSPKMIKKAEEKKIYDVIKNIEISKWLEQNTEKYDLFIAADVLVYVGDLSQLFSNIATLSKSEAMLLFSIELTLDEDYVLGRSGRYAHAESYICQLAILNKFRILKVENAVLRTEQTKDVNGQLFILKYSG